MSDIKIRENRKAKKISQKKLAEITGISLSAIQGYEQGRFAPKHDQIKKIASALGVSLADLAPDRYPMAYDTPEEFWEAIKETRRKIEEQGEPEYKLIKEQRQIEIDRISENEEQLNSSGLRRLADYSDDLVDSGKYKRT